jgi:hypothetical protein
MLTRDEQGNGIMQGEKLGEGAQFAVTYTPFPYTGKGSVDGKNPNVTIWTEDDENWFKVYDFHPLWLYDLERVVKESILLLESRGILKVEDK